jgi:hypothetical protein
VPLVVLHGTANRKRDKEFARVRDSSGIVLTTYGMLTTRLTTLTERDDGAAATWAVCVFDEANKIKNSGTHVTQAAQRIGSTCKLLLSGTPIQVGSGGAPRDGESRRVPASSFVNVKVLRCVRRTISRSCGRCSTSRARGSCLVIATAFRRDSGLQSFSRRTATPLTRSARCVACRALSQPLVPLFL